MKLTPDGMGGFRGVGGDDTAARYHLDHDLGDENDETEEEIAAAQLQASGKHAPPLPSFSDSAGLVKVGRKQLYRTPEGDFNRVSTYLNCLPKPFLIDWAAKVERHACLEAAAEIYAQGVEGGVAEFRDAVERHLGEVRAHQKLKEQAADIGTMAHEEIQRQTRKMLGLLHGPEVQLPDASLVAVMSWQDWLKASGIKPFRCEQTVWDPALDCAGTIDMLSFNREGRLGVVDYKTSKGLYDSHHVQVASYCHMARRFAPIHWAILVRIPKTIDDPQFEVRQLGDLSWTEKSGRVHEKRLTEEQLMTAFRAARDIHRTLFAGGD